MDEVTKPKVHPPGAGGPLPPSITPGWNDPPEILLKSTCNQSPGQKRLLNKRVSFPMASPVPQLAPVSPTSSYQSDMLLTDVYNNFAVTISHLPNHIVLQKDLDRFSANWSSIAGNDEAKKLILLASQHVKNNDIDECRNVHKQLSDIPVAAWFTLFIHSIIVSIGSMG